ncbi:hypothetical protein FUAX_32430 [Fulvitalea axinellae]|uniref:ADP-ribosylglycohydrolase n=1 Tax=Fulvitalea axinellae TaxID=1182444 RepID=A0AAU9DCD8_9BACT|nr:hypothetical protein FUAX_32430 [Fulvitalea axinellae]
MDNQAVGMLVGLAVGDAVGVPFEFLTREEMRKNPAKEMVGYGTHHQPPGTWSDDSSMTFCLAEAMLSGYNLESVASNFIRWKKESYWTARNEVFDIGITTAKSISRLETVLEEGESALASLKYGAVESDNGNGSLMRILPLVFEIRGKEIDEQFRIVWENSALTHRHVRAGMSCLVYLKVVEYLLDGKSPDEAYSAMRDNILELWEAIDFADSEREKFNRVIQSDIRKLAYEDLLSGGYVIESLEASLWCLLKSETYEEVVLKSVNLGHDTDTTAAISGGLAGLYFGVDNIPVFWRASLARLEDIVALGEKISRKYAKEELC